MRAPANWDSAFDAETSVLNEEATTADRAIYDNVDGTSTAVVTPDPVRFRDGDGWQEIDLALVENGGQMVPTASPAEVAFPTDPVQGIAAHESEAGSIVLHAPSVLEGSLDSSVEQGDGWAPDQVVVDGVRGVMSTVTPLTTGFEHDIVYADRDAAEATFTVPFEVPPGVVARQESNGVAFVEGEDVLAHYGGGIAFDGGVVRGSGDDESVDVSLVEQEGAEVTVEVAVDSAWLGDPARQFPVTIDPTYTSTIGTTPGGGDTYVSSGSPTTSLASAVDLRVGKDASGNVYRTFVRFGLGGIPAGALIYEAKAQLVNFQSTSCTPSLVRARTATAGFGATTTWNSQPGVGGVVSDTTFARGPAGCPGGWVSLDATSAVSGWHANPSGNFGLRLSADEATTAGYKRFYSSSFGSGMSPRLVVTYDRLAPLPTRAFPAAGARLTTSTPTLSVNPVTDPDGETVSYGFEVWAGDGLPMTGHIIRSGQQSATSWKPPEGVLADGVTYSWAAWARGGGGWFTSPTSSGTFTVDRRLEGDPAPTETAGPVEVNLATGDAGFSTSSPGVTSLGGPIAPGYTYHSRVKPQTGLTGSYYVDSNGNAAFDDGPATLIRTDATISHDWTNATPFDGLPDEQYMVRWTGSVTVPSAGTYYFGAAGSNGFKISVNGTTVLNRWPSSWAFLPAYGSGVALNAGQTVPIVVDMIDTAGDGAWMQLTYNQGSAADVPVPTSWLAPSLRTSDELSAGWALDLGSGGPEWERAAATDDGITAYSPDGTTLEFDRTSQGGFAPTDGGTAHAALDGAGRITIVDGQTTFVFAADGTLVSATEGASADSTVPLYTWTSTTTGGTTYRRVATITDPVSGRSVTPTWRLPGASCPTAPSGFDTSAPVGSLCELSYWDGTTTSYFYESGQLARIVDPGGATQDFGYTNGLLTSIRDQLAYDAVATSVRADDQSTLYQIAYSGQRAATVTQPAPTSGATRPSTAFTYSTGTTDVAVLGSIGAGGFTRRVRYDLSGRLTAETDMVGDVAETEWNPLLDEVWSVTGPNALRTTTVYDAQGDPTDSYGPAPTSWFGSDRRPLPGHFADVPRQHLDIDQGTNGLAAYWFANRGLEGEPANFDTGVGGPAGALVGSWSTSPTGSSAFSGRFVGEITFASTGAYGLALVKNGAGRVWIDDKLRVDGWAAPGNATGSINVSTPSTLRIRVEFSSPSTGIPSLDLRWTPPGATSSTVPGSFLHPSFGNVTTDLVAGTTTTTSFDPEGAPLGLAASETLDPGGLNLVASYTAEPDGAGWHRPLTRTTPAGATWTYGHYGSTTLRDNPCTSAADPAVQGGLGRQRSSPQAQDGTAITEEVVYDSSGRTVAMRVGTDSWTCTSYDARGRLSAVATPAFGGAPARTVTYDWAVGGAPSVPGDGNPLVSSVSDPTGTITTTVDLLGRTIETVDVWGFTSTTTYDLAGREIEVENSVGGGAWSIAMNNDANGRLDTVEVDGEVISDITYDNDGRIDEVEYPMGAGAAGNGTSLEVLAHDVHDEPSSLRWNTASGGLLTSETVTRDPNLHVIDASIDGIDATPGGESFVYDAAGRLTTAVLADRNPATGAPLGTTTTQEYSFASNPACSQPNAGKNGNRTSLSVNGTIEATYCYDAADRLVSSTAPGYEDLDYDAHGNVVGLAGETRTYDGSDRHIATTAGPTTVSYTRDALDRIVERSVDGVTAERYVYAGEEDVAAAVLDGGNAIVSRTLRLPGGVTVIDEAGPGATWTYPNMHGDVAAVADDDGVKVGPTLTYDPYGVPLSGDAPGGGGELRWGWLGGYHRPAESSPDLIATIEMGARQYDPVLGRFLETDPIEGGSANQYEYGNADPINNTDLDGLWSRDPFFAEAAYRDRSGRLVPIRAGRNYKSRYDRYGQFGYRHIQAGHVGVGKRDAWKFTATMMSDVASGIRSGKRVNSKIIWTRNRILYKTIVTVVVSNSKLNIKGKPILGAKTAYIKRKASCGCR